MHIDGVRVDLDGVEAGLEVRTSLHRPISVSGHNSDEVLMDWPGGGCFRGFDPR